MPLTYSPTTWVNAVTPADQTNMNNIEGGIVAVTNAINTLEGGSYALSLASVTTSGNGTIGGHLTITGYLSSDAGAILSDGAGNLTAISFVGALSAAMTARDDATNHFYGPTPSNTPPSSARGFNVDTWDGTAHHYTSLLDGSGNWLASIPAAKVTAGTLVTGVLLTTISSDSAAITSDGAGNLTVGTLISSGKISTDHGQLLSDGRGTVSGNGTATPAAATLALASGTALGIGVYDYKVTYTTSLGEGALGTLATITTTTGNQDVNLSAIPTGPAGVTGRNIYRTKVGGSVYYLLHSIADNTTTTYSDTTADGTLATVAPAHPSLGGDIWKTSGGSTVAQVFADGAITFDAGNITSDGAGNLLGVAGSGIPMTRNGTAISAPLMSGSSFPTNALPGTVFVKA